MRFEDAVGELNRRLDLATCLSEGLMEVSAVLDGVEGASGLADALLEASEVVGASEVEESEDPDDHEKEFAAVAKAVAPLLQLLSEEVRTPIEEAWEALWKAANPGACTSAPDLDVPDDYVGKRRKRVQVLYRSEVMEKLASDIDPGALSDLLLAMLKAGTMGVALWKTLREGMEEIQEAPE